MWLREVREVQDLLMECGNGLLFRGYSQMFDVQSAVHSPICPVCDQPVRLEDAKTDEDGQAIHDNCCFGILKSRTN
jgi:hypothetical protein